MGDFHSNYELKLLILILFRALRFALNRLAPGFRDSLPDEKSGELKQTAQSLTKSDFFKKFQRSLF